MMDKSNLDDSQFWAFLNRNPQYLPIPGEMMTSVYEKQVYGFIAYVDEVVDKELHNPFPLTPKPSV